MLHNLNDFIQRCTFSKFKVVVSLGMHGHCAESTICHYKPKFVRNFKSRNIQNNIFQMSNKKKTLCYNGCLLGSDISEK